MKTSKKSKSSGIKRKPARKIERKPAKKENKRVNILAKWKSLRTCEFERRNKARLYSIYKNNWFIELVKEATKREHWVKYDIARMKNVRKTIEQEFKIDICYYSAFIYFSTYKFLHWNNRSLEYSNFIGFMCNEKNLVDFANYLGMKHIRLRKQINRLPRGYIKQWGKGMPVDAIKIGKYDKHVDKHLMSTKMDKDFKKYLG